MVAIEEIVEDEPATPMESEPETAVVLASEERRLDAEEIEKVAATITRPTARMHLEALAKKLRKESEALKRVEKSQQQAVEQQQTSPTSVSAAPPSATAAASPSPPASPAVPAAPPPTPTFVPSPAVATGVTYVPIDKFAFDFGEYNSQFVSIYISLPGIGSIPSKDQITCNFTSTSFDLIIRDFKSKSYRLVKDNLEKDIVPEKSKYLVKADKIVVKLAKVKGEYGSYDYWSQLTAKKTKSAAAKSKDNPSASIMDMMKDMYDSGDDNMKKMIGETMMKQRNGELDNTMGMGGGMGSGLGDLSGMGNMGLGDM